MDAATPAAVRQAKGQDLEMMHAMPCYVCSAALRHAMPCHAHANAIPGGVTDGWHAMFYMAAWCGGGGEPSAREKIKQASRQSKAR
jgi:hypothetical protein